MATTVSLKPNAVEISGSTSGTTTLQATAVAGTTTLTLPAATDTLVGKATTDTLTNKTLTGAVMNGTLGATTPSTVAATTLTTSSTVTHNGGTANGVGYLDGSKVLTTGSALVFDGTNFSTTGTIKGSTTISVGGATPSTSGAGITFPATQSASSDANTLDDYEEGTFNITMTPSVSGSITMNLKSCKYTKIGRVVHINALVTLTSVSTPVGTIFFGNLPFAAGANSADANGWSTMLISDNLSVKTKAYINAGNNAITYSLFDDGALTITSGWNAALSCVYSTD